MRPYFAFKEHRFLSRPAAFSPELLQNFHFPLLLIHTKLDESNGTSLLNNTRTTSLNGAPSLPSDSLLPNYNRKSPLANLFNCDEIFIVKIMLRLFARN